MSHWETQLGQALAQSGVSTICPKYSHRTGSELSPSALMLVEPSCDLNLFLQKVQASRGHTASKLHFCLHRFDENCRNASHSLVKFHFVKLFCNRLMTFFFFQNPISLSLSAFILLYVLQLSYSKGQKWQTSSSFSWWEDSQSLRCCSRRYRRCFRAAAELLFRMMWAWPSSRVQCYSAWIPAS